MSCISFALPTHLCIYIVFFCSFGFSVSRKIAECPKKQQLQKSSLTKYLCFTTLIIVNLDPPAKLGNLRVKQS